MTVGSGSPLTLFTATYDQTTCGSLQAAPGALLLHDLSYGLAQTARGNPTQVTKLGSTTCTAYQISGIAYQMKDGNNNTMSITTSSSTAYSLPSVLTPNGNTSFNVNVGYSTSFAVTSVTGPNGTNTNTTYDSYGRPSSSVSVDGATTHYCYTYNANASTQTAVISTSNSCTLPLSGQWKQTTLDGFGRTLKVITGHDGVSMAETDTQYGACACSPLGKMVAQSLPYAYGGSPVWTTCTYDGSGRTLTTVQGDGSTTTNAYSSNSTTTTDPANKWKTFTSDAFGNLVTVTEPDPSGVNVTTNYTYNGANQLTQVSMPRTVGGNQITQTRTFAWTGSDLTSSTNPENGTVTYQYDGTHHVTQRMDAKGQKTTYTYDSYERLTQVQHYLANSNGAADAPEQVNYYYDSNPYYGSYSTNATGRLAAVTFQNESTSGAMPSQVHGGSESFIYSYGYNVAGRVTAQQLTVVPMSGYPAALSATYSWDNQGRMTALNYPRAGPQETLSYDAMSNLTGIGGNMCSEEDNYGNCTSWSPMQLVSGASYTNIGQLSGFSVSVAGLSLGNYAYSYNSLQQLSQMGYSSPSSNTNVNFIYTYAVGHNNGRISQFSDSSTGEVVNYTYDSLNRLIAATTSNSSGPVWGESYTYDGFGNLLSKVPTQGTAPQVYVPVTSSTNQVTPADANGNWQGSNSLANAWDVENRLLFSDATDSSGNLVAYSYDPWGKRVLQYANGAGGVTTCVLYFYGVNGKRLGTYNCYYSNGQFVVSTANINVYFGKKLIASGSETSQNAVITDRLGSVRGQGLTANIAYYPYGEERTSTPDNTDKFGTYFRDGYEQDYADQRYYSSNTGSFFSPDPSMDGVDYENPTSWNAYAYVNGDPINFNDPSGLGPITLPPVVPGINCSTAFINYAAQFGESIQDLFNTDQGILGVMSYFEQQGSGSSSDEKVWAALDWTFINRWNLSSSDKAWFYGPGNAPTSLAATVTTGPTRSQVFTSDGQLPAGFTTQLLNVLTGSPDSKQCAGLADAFDIASGVIEAANGVKAGDRGALVTPIPDPYPGALAFGSNGAVPSHSRSVRQVAVGTIVDGTNSWTFFSDSYTPPPPVRRPPPRRRR